MATYDYTVATAFAHGVDVRLITEELAAAGVDVTSASLSEDGATFSVSTSSAQTPVDAVVSGHAGPGSLKYHQDLKIKEIDEHTQELIDQGFVYDSKVFSLSQGAQNKMMGVHQIKDDPLLAYPIKWNTKDDLSFVELQNASEIRIFYLTAVGTYRTHVDGGTALKDLVRAAVTVAEVDAIVDNR